jgi:hypothetical protein
MLKRRGAKPAGAFSDGTGAGGVEEEDAEPRSAGGSSAMAQNLGATCDEEHPDARRVFTRVTLLRMEEVNTLAQTWSAELYYEFVFGVKAGRIAALGEAGAKEVQRIVAAGGSKNLHIENAFAQLFWPKICFAKGTETEPDEIWVSVIRPGADAAGRMRGRLVAEEQLAAADCVFSFSLRAVRTFSQNFQLELFPLDMQSACGCCPRRAPHLQSQNASPR